MKITPAESGGGGETPPGAKERVDWRPTAATARPTRLGSKRQAVLTTVYSKLFRTACAMCVCPHTLCLWQHMGTRESSGDVRSSPLPAHELPPPTSSARRAPVANHSATACAYLPGWRFLRAQR